MPVVNLKDKFVGCIVGSAIGDALGYPVEFMDMETIRQKYGAAGVTALSGKGARFSDDTQMSVAVIRGFLDSMPEDRYVQDPPEAWISEFGLSVAKRFVEWAFGPDNNRAPGSSCMAGCSALASHLASGDTSDFWRWTGNKQAGGCGSVMRSHPYALISYRNLVAGKDRAVEQSRMTHQHPMALASCAAMVAGVWLSLRDADPQDVVASMIGSAAAYDAATAAKIAAASQAARDGTRPAVVLDRFRGWRADEAIAAATYCFARFPENYEAAVLLAVNSPGDSDSLGAITGALVGARVGRCGIPASWFYDVEDSLGLVDLATQLHGALNANEIDQLDLPKDA